jgi:hypothetical protein
LFVKSFPDGFLLSSAAVLHCSREWYLLRTVILCGTFHSFV